ncbi:MAG: type II secretion system F family protein [Actinobacteria bacterium]|nr:type II secretion system F family protein [Actinomycetota bacterium]
MAIVILLLGIIVLFAGLALLVLTLSTAFMNRQEVNRSLAAIQGMHEDDRPPSQLDTPFTDRVVTPAFEKLTSWGRRFTPDDQSARIRRRLDLAGNPENWDVNRIIAFKMLGLIGGAILGLLIGLLFQSGFSTILGLIVVSALLGYFGPNIALYQVGYNRTQQMARDLPDALDLLTISVESGMAFDSAVSQVARNTTGPLAEEFFRLLQEMQIGLSRSDAIRAMGERSDIPELRNFASSMVQAERLGIPVANVLRIQAGEMRTKRSQRAEEMAQKVPVKILFPLIFCILPVLFIVILGPAVISIFSSLSGK